MLIAAGVALLVVALRTGKRAEPREAIASGQTVFPLWGFVGLLVSIFAIVAGVLLLNDWWEKKRWSDPERRRLRIDRLSESLREALSAVERIKVEVDDGNALLRRLENEADVKRQLAQLSSEEAAAVLAQMRETVRLETSRGERMTLLSGLFFFVAGVIVTTLVTVLIS